MNSMMKKLVFLFAAAMVVTLAAPGAVYAQEISVFSGSSISVSGEASVTMEPNVAFVSLGVETQDLRPAYAQQRNSARMTDVMAALAALGIEESDIRTVWFNMHPVHDWSDHTPRVVGYMVSNNISVTVRDINLVGQVLGAAAEAGANMASSVSFGLLDSTEAYNQALAEAVADATAKARIIATSLGRNLGEVTHVSESGSMGMMPFPAARSDMWFDGGGFIGAQAMGVPIHGGELSVFARVHVTFAIR